MRIWRSVRESLKKVYVKMKTLKNWRRIVLFVCLAALGTDPLFLFIPVIDSRRYCFTFDKQLAAGVSIIRTTIDTFYAIDIIFRLITKLIAPSQESLRGELSKCSNATREYSPLLFFFIVDIISILPIPQVVVLTFIQQSGSLLSRKVLKWIVFSQYVPRIIRVYPRYRQVTRTPVMVIKKKLIRAGFNLSMYMLFSYVFGAFWYVNAIEKKTKCWRQVCGRTFGCNVTELYCARGGRDNSRFLNTSCPLIDPDEITDSTVFNFGMYIDALKSRIVDKEPRDFPRKFFYCFWWGLRNISAFGQNLKTSSSAGDIVFAIVICVSGLLFFTVLIGNVEKYLQSITTKEMKEKKRGMEEWMTYRKIPENLKERIRTYEDHKWGETRGIEEEALLHSLPKDLRLETKRHLYLEFLNKISWLKILDDAWLLEALCDRVKYVKYSTESYIVREGQPVEEMLLITKGNLKCFTETNGYDDSSYLYADDICGDILLWILEHPSSPLPVSKKTISTVTDVEGFILVHDDLNFVASHIHRYHSSKLKHLFRFCSPHWQLEAHIIHNETSIQQFPKDTKIGTTLYVSKSLRNRWKYTVECFSPAHMQSPLPCKLVNSMFLEDKASVEG